MKRVSRVVLMWIGVLVLSSCQPRVPSMSAHLDKETVSSRELLQSLLKRQADIKTLRSFVQTTLERKDQKQSLRQAIIACGEESIRVDTFSLFGQALWVFMHNGGKVLLYDSANNRIYRGAEVADMMVQVVGVAIDFKDIINVFSGNIPRLENHRVNRAYLDKEKNLYQLETAAGQERFEMDLDAMTLLPLKWVGTQNGRKGYAVTWGDYRPVEDRPFPHHIEIENSARQEKLVVNYQNPKINAELSSDVFELPGAEKSGMACRWKSMKPEENAQRTGSDR